METKNQSTLLPDPPRALPTCYDNLMLQDFRNCPTYFYWRHLWGLTRASGMSLPAAFGIGLHKGIESLWKGKSLEEAIADADSEFLAQGHAYSERPPYTKSYLALALKKWDDQLRESNRKLQFQTAEVGFIVPLGPGIDYYGRMDGFYEKSGRRGVYELKTTKSARYIIPNPHNQITGYAFALGEYQQIPTTEITVDVIQLQVRTIEVFRFTSIRSEERLQRWQGETLMLTTFIQQCYKARVFPRNTSHCSAWGGCMFQDLCKLQCLARFEDLLDTYDQSYWEPWDTEEGGR